MLFIEFFNSKNIEALCLKCRLAVTFLFLLGTVPAVHKVLTEVKKKPHSCIFIFGVKYIYILKLNQVNLFKWIFKRLKWIYE